MKKRYAIIIEEDSKQFVEEVKNVSEILDTILSYTDYFTPEDDDYSNDLIEIKDFNALADEIALCYGYNEPHVTFGKRYCDILNSVKNLNQIEEFYEYAPKINELLKDAGINTEIFLNEREDDGCGWCGEE